MTCAECAPTDVFAVTRVYEHPPHHGALTKVGGDDAAWRRSSEMINMQKAEHLQSRHARMRPKRTHSLIHSRNITRRSTDEDAMATVEMAMCAMAAARGGRVTKYRTPVTTVERDGLGYTHFYGPHHPGSDKL
jgi:hypothetical protein